MSDLSPVALQALARLKTEIDKLRCGGSNSDPKPHKLIMLLAVIDLAESDLFPENKIYFDHILCNRFSNLFVSLCGSDDWCQPAPPFFHLRSSGFWHLHPKEGRADVLSSLKTSGGGSKRILENVEYAYLSDYAYLVFQDPYVRAELRSQILDSLEPDASEL